MPTETLTLARGATFDFKVWWRWKDHDGFVHERVSCPRCGYPQKYQGRTLKCADCGKATEILLEGYAGNPN